MTIGRTNWMERDYTAEIELYGKKSPLGLRPYERYPKDKDSWFQFNT